MKTSGLLVALLVAVMLTGCNRLKRHTPPPAAVAAPSAVEPDPAQLKQDLAKIQANTNQLAGENEQLRKALDVIAQNSKTSTDLAAQLRLSGQAIDALRDTNAKLNKAMADSDAKLLAAMIELRKLAGDVKDDQGDIDDMTAALKRLQADNKALADQNDKVWRTVDKLHDDLDKQKDDTAMRDSILQNQIAAVEMEAQNALLASALQQQVVLIGDWYGRIDRRRHHGGHGDRGDRSRDRGGDRGTRANMLADNSGGDRLGDPAPVGAPVEIGKATPVAPHQAINGNAPDRPAAGQAGRNGGAKNNAKPGAQLSTAWFDGGGPAPVKTGTYADGVGDFSPRHDGRWDDHTENFVNGKPVSSVEDGGDPRFIRHTVWYSTGKPYQVNPNDGYDKLVRRSTFYTGGQPTTPTIRNANGTGLAGRNVGAGGLAGRNNSAGWSAGRTTSAGPSLASTPRSAPTMTPAAPPPTPAATAK